MSQEKPTRTKSAAHDHHHAKKRRQRRDLAKSGPAAPEEPDRYLIYGLHTVRQALINPARQIKCLYVSKNALARLALDDKLLDSLEWVESHPRELDRLVGEGAVHQGAVLETKPLEPAGLDSLADKHLLLALDQVTDPHNVGAILRSAVAFGADAVISTARYSPQQTGVLAKAASGALDLIDLIEVRNLAEALEQLNAGGFLTVGLDSEGDHPIEAELASAEKIALVLGAEGKGLRQRTRETCARLARLDMPGAIKSLNVSNAAALSLYVASRALSADANAN